MLEIDSRIIEKPIKEILEKVRTETGKLQFIEEKGDYLRVTCPFHKGGFESHPSCSVYIKEDGEFPVGTFNCFTCHESGDFIKFLSGCFERSKDFCKNWLLENFAESFVKTNLYLKPIELTRHLANNAGETILDENILLSFENYHPYMKTRKLSDDVIKKYEIKYDPKTKSLVFPVRDLNNNLIGLSRRSVEYKRFDLPRFNNKPVYLLNDKVTRKVKKVFVVESQINALTLESWGYDAVALFGTGSKYQYEQLNNSGILYYILAFDGDVAGQKGAKRFKHNVKGIIDELKIPEGEDVNDLSKEEFEKILNENKT